MSKEEFPGTIYKPEDSTTIIANGPLGTKVVYKFLRSILPSPEASQNIEVLERCKTSLSVLLENGGLVTSNGLLAHPNPAELIKPNEERQQFESDHFLYLEKRSLKKPIRRILQEIDPKSRTFHLLNKSFRSHLAFASNKQSSLSFYVICNDNEPRNLSFLVESLGKFISLRYAEQLPQKTTIVAANSAIKQILFDLAQPPQARGEIKYNLTTPRIHS